MKLTIPQPTLAALIERGGAAAAKKSPVAILNYLRLTASADSFALASCDQDRFAEATTGQTIDAPGSICVDAAALTTLIGKHPKGSQVTLELDASRLVVTCGRSKVKLPTLAIDGFPAWPDAAPVSEFAMPAKDFERSMGRVRFAAALATDIARVYLQGVCFDFHDGSLHFVATDGHKLAVSGVAAPAGAEDCPRVIVPSEGIDAALKVFKDAGQIDIAVGEKAVSFATDGLRLSSRLIDATYPSYERVIPARGNPAMSFKRADFVDCLSRANCLAGDGAFSAITANPDGETLRLEARNHQGGEAVEEMAATIGDGFQQFGFSAAYGAQFLAALNVSDITIEQGDPNGPHLLYAADAPDFLGVLMPVRVAA